MKRRTFLGTALAGVGNLLLGHPRGYAADPSRPAFDPYEVLPLGTAGVDVSRVGLGTGMRGWKRESNQTRKGKAEFEKLIRGCYDRGVRLFDLADLYGTHPYILPALKGIPRENITLATKIWFNTNGLPEKERPDADVVVNRFLKELGTEYIDLVLIHCMTSPTWPDEMRKQMDLMSAMKDKGLIRAHGVSCHSLDALSAAADEPWVDSVHARINAYGDKMDAAPDAVVPVLRRIHRAGKGIVGMKLVGEGRFRDSKEKINRSIEFVLNLGCVDSMIVGFESLSEVDDFASRVRKSAPSNQA